MYESGKLELKDIWSEDWGYIQSLMIEREAFKKETAEATERIARLSGKTPNTNSNNPHFPAIK